METYTKEEIEVLKKGLKDWEELKELVDDNYGEDDLEKIINKLFANMDANFNITNYIEDKFCDFNYNSILATIYLDNNKSHLLNYIDIWDDKNCTCICEQKKIEDIQKIIDDFEKGEDLRNNDYYNRVGKYHLYLYE